MSFAHAGMLRASAKRTDTPCDLRGVTDDSVDPRLPWGVELRAFATALVTGVGVADARAALVAAATPEAVAAAAAVCGNFQMMNRILDATGCPVSEGARPIAEALGVELP